MAVDVRTTAGVVDVTAIVTDEMTGIVIVTVTADAIAVKQKTEEEMMTVIKMILSSQDRSQALQDQILVAVKTKANKYWKTFRETSVLQTFS